MPLTQVSSRAIEDTLRYVLGASGTDHYTFTGKGLNGAVNDPTIYLVRGQTYIFENRSGGHPFYIKTSIANGGTNDAYNTGVTNNGGGNGTEIVFTVPHDAPDTLYYQCSSHSSMSGEFKIAGSVADGSITESKLANDAVTADKLADSINSAIAANTAKDLTALSASNLTSGTVPDARFPATLPAISGANLTNLPAGGKVANLLINGGMELSQRGTQSTSSGMNTIDRWTCNWSGGGVTQAQISEQSGIAFENGFSNYLRLTNTSNTTTDTDYRFIGQTIEAQNVANSGWNFKSASSYVTLSFWVRSSLAGTYYGWLNSRDGTAKTHTFSFTLSANTWTKVTKTISGNSGIDIHDNNEEGLIVHIIPWYGTYYTTSSHTLDAWQTSSSTDRTPDYQQNWANTSNATFDLTGVQLEVGNSASSFAFESYDDTLKKCKRYCHVIASATYHFLGLGMQYYSGSIFIDGGTIDMRDTPTMVAKSGGSGAYVYEKLFGNSAQYHHQISLDGKTNRHRAVFNMSGDNTRHGQVVRCSAHSATLSNNEPFVYLVSEI